MRIGIDIDGVLIDVGQFEIDYCSKFFIVDKDRHLENSFEYGSYKIFNATLEEDNELWRKAIYEYVKEPARRFASEAIALLKKQGHEIFIITNRASGLDYCDITKEEMKKIVVNWLKKYKIYYDELIFSSGTKLDSLIDKHIDVMIEDTPKNILAQSKFCKVLCYDARYNKDVENENVIRIYSWYDIYDKIKNMRI